MRFALALGLATGMMLVAGPASAPPAFGPGLPWPNHVEWTEYIVPKDGWVLCRPAVPADSADGDFVCLPLPPESELYVPHIIAGPSEEEKQSQKMSTAKH